MQRGEAVDATRDWDGSSPNLCRGGVLEDGKLCPTGRVSMTRAGLEGFGRSVSREDEIVIEATGNAMAVARVLSSYVARVIIANPLQVKAIAHAHVKTDRCGRRCGRQLSTRNLAA